MQIKALAQATGVDAETIRYYEKEGLLPEPPRRDNGYRDYGPAHLERLAFIRHCRALDLPLADVRQLLALHDTPGAPCDRANALVDEQLRRVRARLQSMRALEQQLLRLRAACTEGPGEGECGILHELVAAAHGEACACHTPPAPTRRPADQAAAGRSAT